MQLNGIDYTLYLVFTRTTSYMFMAVSVLCFVIMVPIYASGGTNAKQKSNWSEMSVCTIINIKNDQIKEATAFFFCFLCIPMIALFFI